MEKQLKTKSKVLIMALVCVAILTAAFIILYHKSKYQNQKPQYEATATGEILIDFNELTQTIDSMDENTLAKTYELRDKIANLSSKKIKQDNESFVAMYVICLLVIIVIFVIIYCVILKPFDELEEFAIDVANGNLEKKLKYKRVNMFGKFTWAFDHMRSEIIRSKKCEEEAIQNNKTVVATLSHDIKTPISSIRGYAEALTMQMDSTPEKRARYAEVIMRKCDDVTRITNDIFLHSIHDLDKLSIKTDEIDLPKLLAEVVESLMSNQNDIEIVNPFVEGITIGDAGRISQVVENIISNSRKYAPGSKISISSEINDNGYIITFDDFGKGIPDEDVPFIFDKFYRGRNSFDAPGAGLGLYIVKFIMEQMNGDVKLYNRGNGLRVNVIFTIKNNP